jgi:hypothetical protein
MSMLRPGEHPDELISAALGGDLSDEEQARLDAHLATCERCRATMAAWTEQRHMVSQLRNAPVPRDLGPRIRAGIESGAFAVPWWRRTGLLVGVGASLATVAAAVVAVLVIGDLLPSPEVASTHSPGATGSAVASVTATGSPTQTTAPTAEPTTPTPVAMKVPGSWFKYRLGNQRSTLELATPAEGTEVPVDDSGFPIEASVSPNGLWMAFRLQGDGSGLVSTYAFSLSDRTLISLGTHGAYSPFARFAWSPDGNLLAYTLLDDAGNADVWLVNTAASRPTPSQLTNTGRSFVGSFVSESALWVSSASEGDPTSYEVDVPANGRVQGASDPASVAAATYPGVFLPVDNRDGADAPDAVAYWRGQMAFANGTWLFTRGGLLYWHGPDGSGTISSFDPSDPQVFDTLQIQPGGAAFESARFDWAPDADGFAVWDAHWTGTPEGDGFPDQQRVYFAHLAGGLKLGAPQALDAGDTQGLRVVDVALGGDQFLGLTVVTVAGSEGGSFGPTAELRLVTRNTGDVPDDMETIGQDHVWNGPPLYPAVVRPNGQG